MSTKDAEVNEHGDCDYGDADDEMIETIEMLMVLMIMILQVYVKLSYIPARKVTLAWISRTRAASAIG